MRHRKAGRQLGRNSSHRKALLRSLITSFLAHERIETTEAKAKEFRPLAERMITLGKRGGVNARRLVLKYVRDRQVISKLFNDISPRFSARQGGYTRLIKTRQRFGDAAPMAVVELVEPKEAETSKKTENKESSK